MIPECQQRDNVIDENINFDAAEDAETELEENTVIYTEKAKKKVDKILLLIMQNSKKMKKFWMTRLPLLLEIW